MNDIPHSTYSGETRKREMKTTLKDINIDINQIIQLIVDVAEKKKSPKDAAEEFAKSYQVLAKEFARDKAADFVEDRMNASGIKGLSDREFSECVVRISEKVGMAVAAYMGRKMTKEQLAAAIGDSGIRDLNKQVLSALGIHEKLDVEHVEDIMKLAPAVVAFSASMAAYKELRKAMDDLDIAKERRLQIEAACQKSITMIRRYREEMDRIVSDYLTDHLKTFESGFDAMDQALLEGDTDGYIRGNTEIQSILGYDVQFTSQDEFDALMGSDDAFKL